MAPHPRMKSQVESAKFCVPYKKDVATHGCHRFGKLSLEEKVCYVKGKTYDVIGGEDRLDLRGLWEGFGRCRQGG